MNPPKPEINNDIVFRTRNYVKMMNNVFGENANTSLLLELADTVESLRDEKKLLLEKTGSETIKEMEKINESLKMKLKDYKSFIDEIVERFSMPHQRYRVLEIIQAYIDKETSKKRRTKK